MNAHCRDIGGARYSNPTSVGTPERKAKMDDAETGSRLVHSCELRTEAGAHCVSGSHVDPVNQYADSRPVRGEQP